MDVVLHHLIRTSNTSVTHANHFLTSSSFSLSSSSLPPWFCDSVKYVLIQCVMCSNTLREMYEIKGLRWGHTVNILLSVTAPWCVCESHWEIVLLWVLEQENCVNFSYLRKPETHQQTTTTTPYLLETSPFCGLQQNSSPPTPSDSFLTAYCSFLNLTPIMNNDSSFRIPSDYFRCLQMNIERSKLQWNVTLLMLQNIPFTYLENGHWHEKIRKCRSSIAIGR